MIAFLRTISAVLFATLLLSIGVYLVLEKAAGMASSTAILIATLLVVLLFTAPFLSVYLWSRYRMGQVRELADAARAVATSDGDARFPASDYGAEVRDLAHAMELLREAIRTRRAHADEQRVMMERIVNGFQEGLLAINRSRRVVLANERFRELFSVTGELVGRPYYEAVRTMSLISAFDRALDGEESRDRVTLSADGANRRIEMRVFPVADTAAIAAVALFIDVSQIERLETIRHEFLDDFSHEVRTPLAGLRGAVETLESGGLPEADERSLWAVVERQLGRLEALVRDLAELNRIESGDLVLERAPVDLKAVLDDLAVDFTSRHGGRVVVTGSPAVAFVDTARIQRVFSNLLDNALKYGGGEAEVDVSDCGGEVVVRIRDHGPGIPADEQERVFNRFYRIDRSRAQTTPGTGLGLAISKHLTLLHGGTIGVASQAGSGATFVVRLPKPPGPADVSDDGVS
jgi:two-component system phosphate regulon sensor histidine kinase PhoR